jgi:ABC-type phosphate transport system substrate-binding protein
MKVSKRLIAAACGLGVAASLIGVSVASADPNPLPGNTRPLQGEGSDTTEEVMNGMSDVIVDGSNNKLISSWNAKGSTAFQTRASGCNYLGNNGESTYTEGVRANGSGNGQKALRDAFTTGTATNGCLDFSRSSSSPSAANLGTVEVKALALATDSLTFALNRSTVIPRQLTAQNLIDIYHCNFGGFTSNTWKALIPQAGSGTRSSWLAKVGLTEGDLTNPSAFPCVTDQSDLGTRGGTHPLQEHDLRTLNGTSIAPVSVAQWVSMMGGGVDNDLRGSSMLGTIKASTGTIPEVSYPISLNTSYGNLAGTSDDFAATRTVYNVLPTRILTGGANAKPEAISVFEDTDPTAVNTALICNRPDVILKFGFAPISTCGTGSIINPQP